MTIGVIAKLKIQEGKNAEFESTFLELQAVVASSEPGKQFLFVTPVKRRQKRLYRTGTIHRSGRP